MEKLLFFAFVLSPGVLFALLRVPEPPTLTLVPTLAVRTPCEVNAHPFKALGTGNAPNAAEHAARSARLAGR